jgi:hypothetical protein
VLERLATGARREIPLGTGVIVLDQERRLARAESPRRGRPPAHDVAVGPGPRPVHRRLDGRTRRPKSSDVAVDVVGGKGERGEALAARVEDSDVARPPRTPTAMSRAPDRTPMSRGKIAEEREAVEHPPRVVPSAAGQARAADLLVAASDSDVRKVSASLEIDVSDLLMRGGRPLLLAPPGVTGLKLTRTLVCWKESRESRRAVADALPILKASCRRRGRTYW